MPPPPGADRPSQGISPPTNGPKRPAVTYVLSYFFNSSILRLWMALVIWLLSCKRKGSQKNKTSWRAWFSTRRMNHGDPPAALSWPGPSLGALGPSEGLQSGASWVWLKSTLYPTVGKGLAGGGIDGFRSKKKGLPPRFEKAR